MKKVTILALHLGYGGIEKAITDLANNLSHEYSVTIASTYKLYDNPVYELNKKVKVEYILEDRLPNNKEFKNYLKHFRLIKAFKEGIYGFITLIKRKKLTINYIKNTNTDVFITTRIFHNKLVGKYANKDINKIGWEHNHHNGKRKYFKKVCSSAKNLNYFVLVSKSLTSDYKKKLKNTNCKCIYIPNMLSYNNLNITKFEENNLVAVGRLSKEKGFFDLIDIFKLVLKEKPDAKLNLIGSGVLYTDLCKYISDSNIQNSVIMHGYQNSDYIHNILSKSSVYVMTSFTESFGIVLLEAFSHGIPCLSFDSAQGANEIIKNGKNGYIIKGRNKEKMANLIVKLLDNKKLMKDLSKEAIKDVKGYYPENIIPSWESII